MFLHCCEVAGARSLITGDNHLLARKSCGKAPILIPSQFLKEFRDELSP
jgi:predicted nucleic acid-binding protein